jgi:hypothetical protein
MVLPLDRAKREKGGGGDRRGQEEGEVRRKKGETDIKETGDQDVHVLRNSCRAREI